jgi:hypothetical protein
MLGSTLVRNCPIFSFACRIVVVMVGQCGVILRNIQMTDFTMTVTKLDFVFAVDCDDDGGIVMRNRQGEGFEKVVSHVRVGADFPQYTIDQALVTQRNRGVFSEINTSFYWTMCI